MFYKLIHIVLKCLYLLYLKAISADSQTEPLYIKLYTTTTKYYDKINHAFTTRNHMYTVSPTQTTPDLH